MGFLDFIKNTICCTAKSKFDGQTLFFKNGQLYKIIGNQDNWYDPKYIITDGKRFDLSSALEISKIPVPKFGIIDVLNSYGSVGMLDYVLRMKAGKCFNRKEIEICSALLWKSTELMFANKYCAWRKDDFRRIVDWHIQLDMIDEAEKARRYLEKNGIITVVPSQNTHNQSNLKKSNTKLVDYKEKNKSKNTYKQTPKMTYAEKERAIVDMTNDSHMQLLKGFPFEWNEKIKKDISPRTHPFCYMNITGSNIESVKSELSKLNSYIEIDRINFHIKERLVIPLEKIVFLESKNDSFTKFICSPITLTGEISKNPISIYFTTTLYSYRSEIPTPLSNTTRGEVFYGKNGKSWFFYYNTIDGEFKLTKID